ncbi:MAG: hypothetical protein DI586_09665 [Micavibrio aeruginosavorus]|uniref:YjbH domain-containing protein n=1 Tax=Micavibrio aeruginosavorus TaxID=349221 RepID=A0A2W5FJE8_9BACT|nr:MAG: hypothetical protein DI586_09665 [Micavibrio aeruginosavorus]
MIRALRFFIVVSCAWHIHAAQADESRDLTVTPNLYGTIGLNSIPSARMDYAGTIRASIAAADPYFHTSFGLQIHDRLFIQLRQSSEISDLMDDPDKVYPGLDFKFKLFNEKKFRPEIAFGVQSAFGHRRMSGEYLAFSKRYENLDFTAGFGWGRFGTRQSVPNPLDWTGSYLDTNRELDGDKPNSLDEWFTGDTGFFAGVEYATPMKGLSLKADWNSDSYKAERRLGMDSSSPYSFGFSYRPTEYADIGVALMDKDTIMARISLKSMVSSWPFKSSVDETANFVDIDQCCIDSLGKDQASAAIQLNGYQSSPYQYGIGWRLAEIKSRSKGSEILRLEPAYFGLKSPSISIARRDMVGADQTNGSAEEIWRNIEFDRHLSKPESWFERYMLSFKLRENFSLSEDDAPYSHRTDFIGTLSHQFLTNLLSETSFRYNLFSNLDQLEKFRPPSVDTVRSNEYYYSRRRFAVERMFVQGFKSFTPDWHVSASSGYLEEMFAGLHGEILYRPWGRNWAAGIEAANVIKRDYQTPFNMGFVNESQPTGHANFYYEFPDTDVTLQASIGQYLGKDKGGTLKIRNRFLNGSTVEAFITATNMHDTDPYGGAANLSSGIRFSLPLGSLRYIPNGSSLEVNAVPVARDAGQRLDIAHPLYEMTEPLSYRHLTQHWGDVAR